MRGNVVDKKQLEWDAFEAYQWVDKRVLCPKNLTGYSFTDKRKVGRRRGPPSSSFWSRS